MEDLTEVYIEILKEFFQFAGEGHSLDEVAEWLQKAFRGLGARVLSDVVKFISDAFFRNADRKNESGLRVKQRGRVRNIYTIFGNTELVNDVCEDTAAPPDSKRRYFSPVLEFLGIRPHQKVTDAVQRELISKALDQSYAKSAESTADGTLSRQSVHNYVREAGPLQKADKPDVLRTAEELHIFMDEEHIALQKDKAKRKSTIMPLGIVAEGFWNEGKDSDNPGRRRLLDPVVFIPSDLKTKTLVKEISGYIQSVYDLSSMRRIVVHGDGAGWICKAFDDDFNVVHALDGYHLQNPLRTFVARFAETKRDKTRIRKKFEKLLEENKKDEFMKLVDQYTASLDENDISTRKKCTTFKEYCENHWDAAAARMNSKDPVPGSCTEALVQHCLSARMSSFPCAWSRTCAGVIGSWRAARLNGVDLKHPKESERQAGPYAEYIRQEMEALTTGPFNWNLSENASFNFDGNSGTQHMLSKMAAGGFRII